MMNKNYLSIFVKDIFKNVFLEDSNVDKLIFLTKKCISLFPDESIENIVNLITDFFFEITETMDVDKQKKLFKIITKKLLLLSIK